MLSPPSAKKEMCSAITGERQKHDIIAFIRLKKRTAHDGTQWPRNKLKASSESLKQGSKWIKSARDMT